MEQAPTFEPKGISPSQFMRELRPEYYSDSEDRVAYILDRGLFEYHLGTMTSRNQTQNFEIFCRKLCERAICPNLRGQTGPDGGGDSKADAETVPVASEIRSLYFEGESNAGTERWAFAFSTKQRWQQKVRSDVEGIYATGRKYDRIVCVTSQFAKSKTRADLEDSLTKQFGIPVTIHDRTWIVEQTIDADRKDLAFNYLNVGELKSDPLRLGPTDYSRLRQLTDIEKSIDNPESFVGMDVERATEALLAAKLARGLEKPRSEVEGRFMRAIRLANDGGTFLQRLEAQYELIWTGFWWYDDVHLLNSGYDAFETLLADSDHSQAVGLLCNLNQLLFNSVTQKLLPAGQLKVEERTARLETRLWAMAADTDRPNNQLEAETSLLIVRMNRTLASLPIGDLSPIWQGFADLIERAKGLGEYDARTLAAIIEAASTIAGSDPEYTTLSERLSAFVAARTSEAEGALVLFRRAQKLDFEHSFDMIRLLGRAALGLTKKEHSAELADAVLLLALAYRSAGLLWAARSSCIFAVATITIIGEQESDIPITIIPALKLLAWIELELNHVPDFLAAIQFLNGVVRKLPLTEDSKKHLVDDLQELDAALGSVLLNLSEKELAGLSAASDILNALGLWMARTGLLYAMGHMAELRTDWSIPDAETDDGVREFLSRLAAQPVGRRRRRLVLNEAAPQSVETYLLGMAVEVIQDGSIPQIMIAEIMLGALEAVFATIPEQRIIPHTEKFVIAIEESSELKEPDFEISELDVKGTLRWPRTLEPHAFATQDTVQRTMFMVAMQVFGFTCMMDDFSTAIDKLMNDEAIQQRITLVHVSLNSFHRVWRRHAVRLSDWDSVVKAQFNVKYPLPVFDLIEPPRAPNGPHAASPYDIKDHRVMKVRSVIDVHAWNRARWRGMGYASVDETQPPLMLVLFEDEIAARKIFERWRERVGDADLGAEIRLSIVRNVPGEAKHHYFAIFASNEPDDGKVDNRKFVAMANRSQFIEPADDVNLSTFLERFAHHGGYYLLPAHFEESGVSLMKGLGIFKRDLVVRDYADLPAGDQDWAGVRKGSPREM
ncbi:tetratricopeptide repeat protein [Phyllobacterium sp. P30BS-XVII]|uniref:tetratricopeptide repeat protein n=1 Tax=Phyllobacterium sp. P30BS-XVII TaxID=2587046 RepID=UPI0015FDC41F|nr:tetratricopeptide repeat protein [Phyllobacterium sp. P30BS-XVII]MBA8903186.1 hypothetical protein [Phyllobacterium sp. P30BS-XVII]